MKQLDRIAHYEALLSRVTRAQRGLEDAMEEFSAIQPLMEELEAYYTSKLWRKDFEADERGELPKHQPRGVLSEDGIYNAITDNRALLVGMLELVGKRIS